MAIKALDLSSTRRYVCKDDKEDPTVWIIGVLTSRDKGSIRDSATSVTIDAPDPNEKGATDRRVDKINTSIERSKINFEAVRRALKGWENFLDPKTNKPIPYGTIERELDGKRREVVKPELMDTIPLEVIMELGDVILGDDEKTAEDLGNSPAPSSEE